MDKKSIYMSNFIRIRENAFNLIDLLSEKVHKFHELIDHDNKQAEKALHEAIRLLKELKQILKEEDVFRFISSFFNEKHEVAHFNEKHELAESTFSKKNPPKKPCAKKPYAE